MTDLHKSRHSDAELISQVHRLLKINFFKIQNNGQLMRLSDPFCIIIIIIIIRYRGFLKLQFNSSALQVRILDYCVNFYGNRS